MAGRRKARRWALALVGAAGAFAVAAACSPFAESGGEATPPPGGTDGSTTSDRVDQEPPGNQDGGADAHVDRVDGCAPMAPRCDSVITQAFDLGTVQLARWSAVTQGKDPSLTVETPGFCGSFALRGTAARNVETGVSGRALLALDAGVAAPRSVHLRFAVKPPEPSGSTAGTIEFGCGVLFQSGQDTTDVRLEVNNGGRLEIDGKTSPNPGVPDSGYLDPDGEKLTNVLAPGEWALVDFLAIVDVDAKTVRVTGTYGGVAMPPFAVPFLRGPEAVTVRCGTIFSSREDGPVSTVVDDVQLEVCPE